MSVAGLGFSLGEAAHAKSDPTAHAGLVASLGLTGEGDESDSVLGEGDQTLASLPSGPLDILLPAAEIAPPPSEEDRAAVALAMVLMAEPSSPTPTVTMPAVTSRWQPSDAFRHDADVVDSGELAAAEPFAGLPPEMLQTLLSAASDDADRAPGEVRDRAPLVATSVVPAAPAAAPRVDLDLSAAPGVDVNLELAGVDLNLELGSGLDLNLELAASVDLHLDHPPVFPVTTLRPRAAAEQIASAGRDESVAPTAHAAVDVDIDTPALAPSSVAAPLALPRAVAVTSRPVAQACVAEGAARADAVTEVIVASHVDRVLLSLEALLANDSSESRRLRAEPDAIVVATHSEKALVSLAAVCQRDASELAATLAEPSSAVVEAAAPVATAHAATAVRPLKVAPRAPATARAPRRGGALGDDLVAVQEGNLDKVRGGFDTGNGVQISFGIERAVYINGNLVTTTSLNVSDLGKISGGQGAAVSAAAGSSNLTLIQNGAGNSFVTGPVSAATVGTVVQNTLNDQKIQSVTSINASVNALQLVKSQNLQSSLRGALTDSLRR